MVASDFPSLGAEGPRGRVKRELDGLPSDPNATIALATLRLSELLLGSSDIETAVI